MSMAPTIFVSMREFLRTGQFGPVRLGDSMDVVRSFFGDPSAVGGTSRRRRTPRIWKYGGIEFHLTDDAKRVAMIFCDTFERLNLGSTVQFDCWFFEGHPSVEAVERELSMAGIAFSRHDTPYEPATFLLRLDSGVELMFCKISDPEMWPSVPGLSVRQSASPFCSQ